MAGRAWRKGNEGVAGHVQELDGAIGYVELIYATQKGIAFGSIRNSAGNFVRASLHSCADFNQNPDRGRNSRLQPLDECECTSAANQLQQIN